MQLIHTMGVSAARYCRKAVFGFLLLGSLLCLRAEWQRTDTTLAWAAGGKVVWRFSFDPAKGKPFFHPVTVGGGPSLTDFRPADHPWHYALWFSWKYINEVNYWEENRETGKSGGKTSWSAPSIETHPDGSAVIKLIVSYTHPSGRVDLSEDRTLTVSAPDAADGYTIDWQSNFTAGPAGAELGRTPMPGEPNGAVNGGYAGLSVRLAAAPLAMAMVTADGPVTTFANNRARPNSAAVGCNFSEAGNDVGALAILSDPANCGGKSPWYLISSDEFRFADAAILAPKVVRLAAGGEWKLHYRIAVRRVAWTPEALNTALAAWPKP
jgi:hypothetical protein